MKMVQVSFTDCGGTRRMIDARGGLTLMEVALQNDVLGIDGECGGACSCATCHVYVDDAWIDRVGAPGSDEDEMLQGVQERRTGSRLSCQIKLAPELHGLAVQTPARQG